MTASWAWAAASSSCVAKAVAAAAMAAAHADADDDDVDADADAGANAGVDEDAAAVRLSGSACSPPYPWSCKQTKTGEDFRCVCASVCKFLCVREGVFVSAAPAPGGRMACAQYHLRIATDRGACGQWQAWPTLWHAARIKFHALLRG